ncbi:hypothetical protein F4679DRAFT_541993 [Xylaria curta]|nr:hypothetical protein F4679DRAFT_541993 [Xylaria curta]
MVTSQDAEYYPVRLGIWTSWSRGPVSGSTLTLRRQEDDLLIVFAALFVAFISTRGWRIISFAFHRYYASSTPQEAVYHQHQAILRNSSDPQSSILLLTGLIWTNRINKRKVIRLLLTILVAVVYSVAFTGAGGLSSQISTSIGTEVLIKSKKCGWNDGTLIASEESGFLYDGLIAEEIENAANYAQQCYSSDTTGILDCGRLNTKRIIPQIDTQANCPFHSDVCRNDFANLRVDSRYIDSHDHFGLNTRPTERLLTRYVLHCTPMKTQGYSSQRDTAISNITVYHYGNLLQALQLKITWERQGQLRLT